MFFGEVSLEDAVGAILAHSRKLGGKSLKKGHILTIEDVAALASAGLTAITVARLDVDDVDENDAARQIATALAGGGLDQKPPFTGRCNLFAQQNGLLQIDKAALDRVNLVDESITVATLATDTVVSAGQMIATIKIIPFATSAVTLEACLQHARTGGPVLQVAPFRSQRAVLIQTEMPDTNVRMLDKTRQVVERRLANLGIELLAEHRCPHQISRLTRMINDLEKLKADMILIAGASAIVDRRDVIPQALREAGGKVGHFGMPVDPGNLLMTGSLDAARVIGLPGCARSPKYNGLDMVLGRIAADLSIDGDYIMRLGGAGLLKEFASRPQPRLEQIASDRSQDSYRISAIVLAAGQSRRMGRENKLLLDISGTPMVVAAVEAAGASKASDITVVTGHESDRVRQALAAYDVRFIENPDYGEGLSSSLRAGLAGVEEQVDGVVICLGDMPKITATHINRLIASFDPVEGRSICVPMVDGKRGNPVLWSTEFLDDICAVAGDTGARHLIGENEDVVVEVAFDDKATITDVDTQEMYDRIRQDAAIDC